VLGEIAAAVRNNTTYLVNANDSNSAFSHSRSCIKPGARPYTLSKVVPGQALTFQSYTIPVGKLMIQQTSHVTSPANATISTSKTWERKCTWIFMPSLFSRCIQLQYASSFETINWSFRIYPVISIHHPVWDICINGDISSLRTLFSERKVSPFSVSRQGRSLLHVGGS
jgi:hypothetical protein